MEKKGHQRQKKKKHKTSKPPIKTALTDDDYELTATRTHDTLKDSFDVIQSSQEKIQSAVEKKLLDFKLITENTALIHIPPVKASVGESSTQPISREETLTTDRINTIMIPPRSIRFPASATDAPIEIRQPIEVNLVEFHIDQL